jgi:hypothetical protein
MKKENVPNMETNQDISSKYGSKHSQENEVLNCSEVPDGQYPPPDLTRPCIKVSQGKTIKEQNAENRLRMRATQTIEKDENCRQTETVLSSSSLKQFFFFLVVLGFELRASHMLGRHSYCLNHPASSSSQLFMPISNDK